MEDWAAALRNLKSHAQFPFSSFQFDAGQYSLLELYWTLVFNSTVRDTSAYVAPWHVIDADREGNPIFSALDLTRRRGTRVIQWAPVLDLDPGDPHIEFQPFLTTSSGFPYDSSVEVLELCFVAAVSEEAERLARRFWQMHFLDQLTARDIERHITDYERQVRMPSVDDALRRRTKE